MRTFLVALIGFTVLAVACTALPGSAGARNTSVYGGLGATLGAFKSKTHDSTFTCFRCLLLPPKLLNVGYRGGYRRYPDARKHRRVTAYHVRFLTTPPLSAPQRLALLGGSNLPVDARETNVNSSYCIVWHSRTLGRLIGMQYAAATTPPGKPTAHIHAERKPHC